MNYEGIPGEMKALPNWILYRLEDRGGDKPTKVPYAVSGSCAKTNDPITWATFDAALVAFQRGGYAGLGFVFTGTPYVGIDIDGCVDPVTSKASPEAQDAVRILNSYTELSQSCKGLHIIIKGTLPAGRRRNGAFEMYGEGSPRYFAMTGDVWDGQSEIHEGQAAIDEVHYKYIQPNVKDGSATKTAAALTRARQMQPASDSDEQLLDKVRRADPVLDALYRGDWKGRYPSQSEADLALCAKLAFWFQKDAVRIDEIFRRSSLFRAKWDEKHHGDGSTYGQKTVEMAISGCRDVFVSKADHHQGSDALVYQSLTSHPGVMPAPEMVLDKLAAARAERKAQEKREAEMGLVIRQAAAINLAGPAKPAFDSIIAYTARELRARDIKPTPVIVDGLLPAGFSILAGAPKRGKSWMALDLAISVATGRPFLGRRTLKGKVLYLDLESGESRAKKRLSILLPGEWPENLYISHRADMLGDNGKLLLQIEEWLDKNPDTRLIIVDTIGRVKGGGRRSENAYETDTRLFGALQALAVARGIAILGIHHYKKGVEDGDDWFEKISGSMGLTGVCDTVLALTGKRDEQDCVLKSSSRDFEGIGDMVLRFDGGSWIVQGTDPQAYAAEKAYRESGIVRGILALMDEQPEWQGTPTQLLDAVMAIYHGQLETYNPSKLGTELERIMGQMYDSDGIVIVRKKVNGRRVLSIRKGSADVL